MENKTCSYCGKYKSVSDFNKNKYLKDGYSHYCRACDHKRLAAHYINNRKIYAERGRNWQALNPNYSKNYYIINRHKILEYQHNKLEARKNRLNERYRNDAGFRIEQLLRSRIRCALSGAKKSARTIKLLGCDVEFFKSYFQELFTKEMTWKKFADGEIHIDHIKPCSSFDLTDLGEQKKCFHFTNLQPLWAIDNLRKGSKHDR